MKDAYYFPHDSNARNDPRMLLIRAKYGIAGYGAYFMIVEILRDEETLKLPVNEDLYPMIALGIGAEIEFVEKLVDECVKKGLLVRDKFLYSPSLIRRLRVLAERRERKSSAGKKGAEKRWEKHGENSKDIAEGMADGCQNNGSRTEEGEETEKVEELKQRNIASPSILMELWNEKANKILPRVKAMTASREKHARIRISENNDIAYWRRLIQLINLSDFCLGKNDRGWRADIDWLLRPDTGVRILEGKYENRANGKVKDSAGAAKNQPGKYAKRDGIDG